MQISSYPGVYIQEISTLPPSVAPVATAIPAFLGYTTKGKKGEVEIEMVTTLLEFEDRFGLPPPTAFKASSEGAVEVLKSSLPEHMLWYAMSLYFRNGGGKCYVVSVDNTSEAASPARFKKGLEALEAVDEPTLIVMPGIVSLPKEDFHDLNQQSLAHCKKLQDRFAILDVQDGDVPAFREGIGTEGLMYGAAYHPYLQTTINFVYAEDQVTIAGDNARTLKDIKTTDTLLYNKVKKNLDGQRVALPPSAAVAGVYARTDRDRGVWKAPANTSVSAVIAPVTTITNAQQETLNVDPKAGKSINAIRAFSGKGTVVWGARTLDGNSNEWRYVNVRRLFITIEESAKNASHFAVFEPNDATTWLKVKGMLDAYLFGLWEQGALQGSKPEHAFQVHVGLGKTMTPQDILEGRLIVELKIAAVRPAEFVVLRFEHKLAES